MKVGWGAAGNSHAGALKINCKGGKNVKKSMVSVMHYQRKVPAPVLPSSLVVCPSPLSSSGLTTGH